MRGIEVRSKGKTAAAAAASVDASMDDESKEAVSAGAGSKPGDEKQRDDSQRFVGYNACMCCLSERNAQPFSSPSVSVLWW